MHALAVGRGHVRFFFHIGHIFTFLRFFFVFFFFCDENAVSPTPTYVPRPHTLVVSMPRYRIATTQTRNRDGGMCSLDLPKDMCRNAKDDNAKCETNEKYNQLPWRVCLACFDERACATTVILSNYRHATRYCFFRVRCRFVTCRADYQHSLDPFSLSPLARLTVSYARFVHDDVLLLSLADADGGDDHPTSCFGIFEKEPTGSAEPGRPRFSVTVRVSIFFRRVVPVL